MSQQGDVNLSIHKGGTTEEWWGDLIYVQIGICALLAPLIVFSNTAVVLTTYLVRSFHTPHNIIIAGISVVDMCVGLLWLPADIISDFPDTKDFILGSKLGCQFHFMMSVFLDVSLTYLLFMSADRSLAIQNPFWYNVHVSNRKIITILVVLFGIEFIAYLVIAIHIDYDENKIILEERCSDSSFPYYYTDKVWNISVAVRIGVAFILDARVVRTALSQVRRISSLNRLSVAPGPDETAKELKKNKNSINTTLFLMFTFVVLWSPSVLEQDVGFTKGAIFVIYGVIATVLRTSNSFINVIVFAYMKKSFRVCYKVIITTNPCRWPGLRDTLRVTLYEFTESESRKQQEKASNWKSEKTKVSPEAPRNYKNLKQEPKLDLPSGQTKGAMSSTVARTYSSKKLSQQCPTSLSITVSKIP